MSECARINEMIKDVKMSNLQCSYRVRRRQAILGDIMTENFLKSRPSSGIESRSIENFKQENKYTSICCPGRLLTASEGKADRRNKPHRLGSNEAKQPLPSPERVRVGDATSTVSKASQNQARI